MRNAWLVDGQGCLFAASQWRQYRGCLLADFTIEYVTPGHIRVKLPQHIQRPGPRVLRRFELWVWALVVQTSSPDTVQRVVATADVLPAFTWTKVDASRFLGWRQASADEAPALTVLTVADGVGTCVATEGDTGVIVLGTQLRLGAHPEWCEAPLLETATGTSTAKDFAKPRRILLGRIRLKRHLLSLRRRKRPPTAAPR